MCGDPPQRTREEHLSQLLGDLGQRLQVVEGGLTAIRVARTESRGQQLLEQACLPVGGGAEGAQVSRVDPIGGQLHAGGRDVGIADPVALLTAVRAWRDEAVLLQLSQQGRRGAGARAELACVDFFLGPDETRRPAAPLPLPRSRCGQLLPDHAQRQELVALETEDRPETFDVVFVEEPVAALRPLRLQQALILEVPDLRDRDVRKLVLQRSADGADVQQPLGLGRFGRGTHVRKVSLYLPICTSSPSSSAADSMRRRFRNVPLRLPWSSIRKPPSPCLSRTWCRETVTSSRKMSHSGERPTVIRSCCRRKCSPARPPPERTTSAGPSVFSSSASGEAASSSPSSGVKLIVVSEPDSSRTSSAPHFAQ